MGTADSANNSHACSRRCRAEIPQPLSPHHLPHEYATLLRPRGADVRHVQQRLGHTSLDSTAIDTQVGATQPLSVGVSGQVTVFGNGTCGPVTINDGDGIVITYAISGLPISRLHAWTTPGQKTITATGESTCHGTASATITIGGLDCERPSASALGWSAGCGSPDR